MSVLENTQTTNVVAPSNTDEKVLFRKLQANFPSQFESVFPNKLAPKTVVIIPSLTLDEEILSKVDGSIHYEERLLCLLLLLRMPNTHLVYITSNTIDPIIVDYYLHLLPGVSEYHARNRLTLLSCYDSSSKPLTQKILERPRLIHRIRKAVPFDHLGHITCFNVTELERSLAVKLQLPIYGCDPDLYELGNKSNSRILFKQAGLNLPPGYENLHTQIDIVKALFELKQSIPDLKKAVIKMNEGFSGEGNAVFKFPERPSSDYTKETISRLLPSIEIVARDLSFANFIEKFEQMGGIVEAYIEGDEKQSPSVQCRINPLGRCDILSTHDQELKGQVFSGAYFPASPEYSRQISEMALVIAEKLRDKGVIGRFAIDFLSVKEENQWKHFILEINLRKGGTTHPYLMLQFLTEGKYEVETGEYLTANNLPRYYYSTDNLQNPCYKGLTPHDLIDIAVQNDLLYSGTSQQGVMFHLIGALSQFGKLGLVCIGDSPQKAREFYHRTVNVLNQECI